MPRPVVPFGSELGFALNLKGNARRKRYKRDKGVSRVLPSSPHRREGLFYGEARRKFLLGLSLTGFDPIRTLGSPVSVGVSAASVKVFRRTVDAP